MTRPRALEGDGERLRAMISGASELIGAIGGAGVTLVGGPGSALGGAAAGVALTRALARVGDEVFERCLVRRQRERVGAALGVMTLDAELLAQNGAEWRTDAFFEMPRGGRSDAEETIEGVLLRGADCYQELKLRHLAAIVPAVAAREDVSAADGIWIGELVSKLTWRQIVTLSVLRKDREPGTLLDKFDRDTSGRRAMPGTLGQETEELARLELIGTLAADGATVERTVGGLEHGVWQIGMPAWRLTDLGRLLAELTRLDAVPRAHRADLERQLRAA